MFEKTVAQKLLIKENYNVLILNEPDGYREILGELPEGSTVSTKPEGTFDHIQAFITSKSELKEQLEKLKSVLSPNGLLWLISFHNSPL